MKVAIYGDSWGDPNHGHYQHPHVTLEAWPTLLAQHGWSVTNYSRSGSSLHYSYQQFLDTHSDHDRVIFIVTSIGRWTRHLTLRDGKERWVNGYDSAEFLLNKDPFRSLLRSEDRPLLEHLKNYYLWVQDISFETTAHLLILEDIKKIRPDALLIPISRGVGVTATPMVEYQELFVRSCWPDRPDLLGSQHHKTWEETACVCHMTPEINRVVCASMRAALAMGSWNPHIPDRVEHAHPGSHYVRLFKE
jgi:hypothetical protein